MPGSRYVSVSINGLDVVAIVTRSGVRRKRRCVRYRSGSEYCWDEHYLHIYLPKSFAELGENDVLVIARVPRSVLERRSSEGREERSASRG